MSGPAHKDIERLMAWSQDGEALADGPLSADLSKALAGRSGAEASADDIARTAAYLDGALDAAQRDAWAERLAGSAEERADMDDAAALLERVEREPQPAPAHLVALAKARIEQAAAAPAPPARWGGAWAGLFGSRLGWSMAAAAAAVVIVPLAMLRTQTATPFANAPAPGPTVALTGPVGPNAGGGGIGMAPAIVASSPSAPPAAPLPTPSLADHAAQPQILSAPSAADQVAAGDQSAHDAAGVLNASDRCVAEGAASSDDAGRQALTAKQRQARDACEAERALARRRAETLAAARENDYHAAAADTAPAAAADAYRPLLAQAPAQADIPPGR